MRLKYAVLWGIIFGAFITPVFAQTEYHREQPDGSIQIEIFQTPQEQVRAQYEYDLGGGVRGTFLDSYSQTPKYVTKEVYEAQVVEIGERVMGEGQRILNEAGVAHCAGNMSDEEYLAAHSQIQLMNGNIRSQQSSIKQSLAQAKPINEQAPTPTRTIKVVPKEYQRRVLVS